MKKLIKTAALTAKTAKVLLAPAGTAGNRVR